MFVWSKGGVLDNTDTCSSACIHVSHQWAHVQWQAMREGVSLQNYATETILGWTENNRSVYMYILVLINHLFNREKVKRFDIQSWEYYILKLDVFIKHFSFSSHNYHTKEIIIITLKEPAV